jgi:hypothetical protein
MPIIEDQLTASVAEVLNREIESIKERIIEDAKKQFDTEVRQIAAKVAIDLTRYFSVDRLRNDLVITIHDRFSQS